MAHTDIHDDQLLTIRDHINHLRRWLLQQQPALNSLDTDEFLLRFLRVTDFRVCNAKQRLVRFWQHRAENPQWFAHRDLLKDPLMNEIAAMAYCLQLPKATKEKHLIFLMRLGRCDPTRYTLDDVTRYAFAVTDLLNSQPTAQLYGFVIVLDFSNIRLQHLTQFTPDRIRRYLDCWEKMYPVHLRHIHVYNYPLGLNAMFYLFRVFYRGKYAGRVYFHARSSDDSMRKSLHRHIDPALLPVEYGGQLGAVESDLNKSFMQWTRERAGMLSELDRYGVDLELVPQLLENIERESHS